MILKLDRVKSPLSLLFKLGLLVGLLAAGNLLADWFAEMLNFELRPHNEDMVHRLIVTATMVYMVLIAVPFLPGIEVGLALISMLGPQIVFLVYAGTLAGLSASFILGRYVPLGGLISLLEQLRFTRAAGLIRSMEPLSTQDRLLHLTSIAPNRLVPILIRHRYLALAIAINLPGNFLIGGGGGIGLMAGSSRLFTFPAYIVTIAIAVSPLPLAILVLGPKILG